MKPTSEFLEECSGVKGVACKASFTFRLRMVWVRLKGLANYLFRPGKMLECGTMVVLVTEGGKWYCGYMGADMREMSLGIDQTDKLALAVACMVPSIPIYTDFHGLEAGDDVRVISYLSKVHLSRVRKADKCTPTETL